MTLQQFDNLWNEMRSGFYFFAVMVILFGFDEKTMLGRLAYFFFWMIGWYIFVVIKHYIKTLRGTNAG